MFKNSLLLHASLASTAMLSDINHHSRHNRRRSRRTTYHQPHGQRERARRVRQILEGQLTRANGVERGSLEAILNRIEENEWLKDGGMW